MKGSRVACRDPRAARREDRHRPWSDDARTFVQQALNPPDQRFQFKPEATELEVIVPAYQLRCPLKEGQNVGSRQARGLEDPIKSESRRIPRSNRVRASQGRASSRDVPGLGDKIITKRSAALPVRPRGFMPTFES